MLWKKEQPTCLRPGFKSWLYYLLCILATLSSYSLTGNKPTLLASQVNYKGYLPKYVAKSYIGTRFYCICLLNLKVLPFHTICLINPNFLKHKIIEMKTCFVIFFCHYLLESGNSAGHTFCTVERTQCLLIYWKARFVKFKCTFRTTELTLKNSCFQRIRVNGP